MSDTLASLLTSSEGASLGKFISPAAEHLGMLTFERAQQLSAKAMAMLTTAGREPQPVETKLLIPLVQAASLEDNPVLAEKWAALLANAACSSQAQAARSSHIEMLRQLTPLEAQLLDELFAVADKSHTIKSKQERLFVKLPYRKQEALKCLLNLGEVYAARYPPPRPGKSAVAVGNRQDFDAMIDSFLR